MPYYGPHVLPDSGIDTLIRGVDDAIALYGQRQREKRDEEERRRREEQDAEDRAIALHAAGYRRFEQAPRRAVSTDIFRGATLAAGGREDPGALFRGASPGGRDMAFHGVAGVPGSRPDATVHYGASGHGTSDEGPRAVVRPGQYVPGVGFSPRAIFAPEVSPLTSDQPMPADPFRGQGFAAAGPAPVPTVPDERYEHVYGKLYHDRGHLSGPERERAWQLEDEQRKEERLARERAARAEAAIGLGLTPEQAAGVVYGLPENVVFAEERPPRRWYPTTKQEAIDLARATMREPEPKPLMSLDDAIDRVMMMHPRLDEEGRVVGTTLDADTLVRYARRLMEGLPLDDEAPVGPYGRTGSPFNVGTTLEGFIGYGQGGGDEYADVRRVIAEKGWDDATAERYLLEDGFDEREIDLILGR